MGRAKPTGALTLPSIGALISGADVLTSVAPSIAYQGRTTLSRRQSPKYPSNEVLEYDGRPVTS